MVTLDSSSARNSLLDFGWRGGSPGGCDRRAPTTLDAVILSLHALPFFIQLQMLYVPLSAEHSPTGLWLKSGLRADAPVLGSWMGLHIFARAVLAEQTSAWMCRN